MSKQFRDWDELEDYEKDSQLFVQNRIIAAKALRLLEERQKRKKKETRRRLYWSVKRAGRKRAWRENGGERRTRDSRGRFV